MGPRSGNVIELLPFRNRTGVFKDREDAARILDRMLDEYRGTTALVLGVPSGGVPVAAAVAKSLGLALDTAVVSKITLPWNSEMGYGGVAFDGTVELNTEILPTLGLSERQIREGIADTRDKVARRIRLLRGDLPPLDVSARRVILVDDGLASGVTIRAAVKALRASGAAKLVVAVPTGHQGAVFELSRQVEALYCANIRGGWSFAVADAYRHWTDVPEDEVARILAKFRATVEHA